ncbi:hypothetical protein FTO74_14210 [Granulicella sp. WH15]|uniref:hypothetical protein n=1 Tax=Granulicella sp. WH15 TaxID=2602070 RepID=UPI0013679462|nr:hypothetical protein [Granulicella sp. WH15]QHN04385.1 hypothetical protein FTO74_14210 [Granulicella sp. WH15]
MTAPQLDLFDLPQETAEFKPKLALPFQASATIDVDRASKILDVSRITMRRMLEKELFRAYYLMDRPTCWRIEYDSVVDYCDRLRVHYAISIPRSPLGPGRKRRRDEELLPFPKEQTVGVGLVMKVLDCSSPTVSALIESGTLVAYQILINQPGSPWRIYRPSFERYVASLHQMARGTSSQGSTSVK